MSQVPKVNERLRTILFESNVNANILFDSGFSVVDCNPAACKFLGFNTREELIASFYKRTAEYIPKFQSNGQPTVGMMKRLTDTIAKGQVTFETEIHINDIVQTVAVDMKKIPYNDDFVIVMDVTDLSAFQTLEKEYRLTKEQNDAQIAKINLAVKSAQIGLWEMEVAKDDPTDPDNIYTWSDELRHMLGFENKIDFPDGATVWVDCLHPEDRDRVLDAFNKHLLDTTGEKPFDIEYRARKKNGEYIYLHDVGETIRNDKGKALRSVGVLQDITETRNMLLENEMQLTKLKLILKAAKIGMWRMHVVKDDPVNPDNAFLWSDEFRYMLGFTDENDFPDLLSSWSERLHPEDKDITLAAFAGHLLDTTGQTPYDVEYRLMKKDGTYGHYRASGETIRDADGNAFRVVGSLLDITETKNELINNERQLSKLDLVIKATKIGLWEAEIVKEDPANPANPFIWSDEFKYMLGYTNDEFPNLFSSLIDRMHPDEKQGVLEGFASYLLDTEDRSAFDLEHRVLKKDGTYAYCHVYGEAIRDENGQAIYVAGSLMDVTEIKNLILEAEDQRMEAEAANKAKSAFLSTMSHEIRTPMNAILGITEIQLQNEGLAPNVKEAFEKVYASGDMLLGIINDILDLSKIEAGKLELQFDTYETASFISDTAQLNMMRIGSKPIEFELVIDENMPAYLLGDELRVKQILNNLLSNAFKYTKAGTVTLSVTSEKCESEDEVMLVISVSDTGQGMTREQIAKLFDAYSRFNMKANRTTEGTGLGMNITDQLIRLMNGHISVESEPDKGSKFTIKLPQGNIKPDILGREMAENLQQFRTRSRAQMKRVQITREPMPYGSVLIVDDVETNIYVAKGLMAPYGLTIDSADSGFAAIEKVKSGKTYDIIFMDHMMPQMDGIETTKHLREMGYTQPIVALTANAVAGQASIFLGNGFDDFVSKPIDIRQLNTVLNKLIRDRKPPEVIKAARQNAEAKNKQPEEKNETGPVIDPHFAEIFVRDALKSLVVLEEIMEKGSPESEEQWRTYVIHIHGMKSALANIGNMELSAIALKLEELGREVNAMVVSAETPPFLRSLRSFVEGLLPDETAQDSAAETEDDAELLHEKLLAVKAACEEYDESTAEEILKELKSKTWSKTVKELLSNLSAHLLHSDFDEVVEEINKFLVKS